jgi:hypothetical protein
MDDEGKIVHKSIEGVNLVDMAEVHIEAGSMFNDQVGNREERILRLYELQLIDAETAQKEIAFRTGNRFILDKMKSYSRAIDALRAIVVGGRTIKIFPDEDLKSYKDVFGDFIHSDRFYDVHPLVQEYLRDTLAGIVTYGMDPMAYIQMAQGTVIPRQDSPSQAGQAMAFSNSPASVDQMQGAQQEGAQMKAEAESTQGVRSPL